MIFYIGMSLEEAKSLFASGDIYDEHDMKNGYYWVSGWANIFGEKTFIDLCFKERILYIIDIAPHLNVKKEREPFGIDMDDYGICKEWVQKHKEELPDSAEAYYEHRTPSVGVCIR